MRVVIVGAGAMGSLFGYLLHRAEIEVWLLDNNPGLVAHVKQNGLRIEGIGGDRVVSIPITANASEIGGGDLIIIFVKAYDTARAIRDAQPLLGKQSVVLTLQNGIGNVEAIAEVAGEERVLAGTIAHGATVLGFGHVRHAGAGETIIGELDGTHTERLQKIVGLFASAALDVHVTEDVNAVLWSKLLVNVGINPLTALTGLSNGELLTHPEIRALMHRAVEEAHRVAMQKGIRLAYPDPLQKVDSVCEATAANISSMLQDLRHGKKTEIDFINGAVVKEGRILGMALPINQALVDLIHLAETS
jgi:2-dehydropantoate 2-reductase